MSQETEILQHLQSGKTLDPLEALRLFNSWALSSRISNLKKMGYPIKTRPIHSLATNKTYAEYYLETPTSSSMPSSEIVEPAPTSEQKIEYKTEKDGQIILSGGDR